MESRKFRHNFAAEFKHYRSRYQDAFDRGYAGFLIVASMIPFRDAKRVPPGNPADYMIVYRPSNYGSGGGSPSAAYVQKDHPTLLGFQSRDTWPE